EKEPSSEDGSYLHPKTHRLTREKPTIKSKSPTRKNGGHKSRPTYSPEKDVGVQRRRPRKGEQEPRIPHSKRQASTGHRRSGKELSAFSAKEDLQSSSSSLPPKIIIDLDAVGSKIEKRLGKTQSTSVSLSNDKTKQPTVIEQKQSRIKTKTSISKKSTQSVNDASKTKSNLKEKRANLATKVMNSFKSSKVGADRLTVKQPGDTAQGRQSSSGPTKLGIFNKARKSERVVIRGDLAFNEGRFFELSSASAKSDEHQALSNNATHTKDNKKKKGKSTESGNKISRYFSNTTKSTTEKPKAHKGNEQGKGRKGRTEERKRIELDENDDEEDEIMKAVLSPKPIKISLAVEDIGDNLSENEVQQVAKEALAKVMPPITAKRNGRRNATMDDDDIDDSQSVLFEGGDVVADTVMSHGAKAATANRSANEEPVTMNVGNLSRKWSNKRKDSDEVERIRKRPESESRNKRKLRTDKIEILVPPRPTSSASRKKRTSSECDLQKPGGKNSPQSQTPDKENSSPTSSKRQKRNNDAAFDASAIAKYFGARESGRKVAVAAGLQDDAKMDASQPSNLDKVEKDMEKLWEEIEAETKNVVKSIDDRRVQNRNRRGCESLHEKEPMQALPFDNGEQYAAHGDRPEQLFRINDVNFTSYVGGTCIEFPNQDVPLDVPLDGSNGHVVLDQYPQDVVHDGEIVYYEEDPQQMNHHTAFMTKHYPTGYLIGGIIHEGDYLLDNPEAIRPTVKSLEPVIPHQDWPIYESYGADEARQMLNHEPVNADGIAATAYEGHEESPYEMALMQNEQYESFDGDMPPITEDFAAYEQDAIVEQEVNDDGQDDSEGQESVFMHLDDMEPDIPVLTSSVEFAGDEDQPCLGEGADSCDDLLDSIGHCEFEIDAPIRRTGGALNDSMIGTRNRLKRAGVRRETILRLRDFAYRPHRLH
ncbi:hypothetical protein HK102_000450, partial [Quaeritorhiza haematococci]